MLALKTYRTYQSVDQNSWVEALRLVMPVEYRDHDQDSLDTTFERLLRRVPLQEREAILGSLGKIAGDIGRGLLPHAGTIGTIGGAAIGTAVLGPGLGTSLGASLGGAIGSAVAPGTGTVSSAGVTQASGALPGLTAPSSVPEPQPVAPVVPPVTIGHTGSPLAASVSAPAAAANQLLIVVNNPHFLIEILRTLLHRSNGGTQSLSSSTGNAVEGLGTVVGVLAERTAIEATVALPAVVEVEASETLSPESRARELFARMYAQREQLHNSMLARSSSNRLASNQVAFGNTERDSIQ